MLFICEYMENRITHTERIKAESHQDAAEQIKTAHPDATYISVTEEPAEE